MLAGAAAIDPAGSWRAMAASVGADVHDPVTGSRGTAATVTGRDAVTAIRAAYRREMLAIAGRDLSGELSVEDVTAALTELAGATLQAALAVAAAEARPHAKGAAFDLAVIAMGKTGGRELNYVSDVDVIFVAEPAARGIKSDAEHVTPIRPRRRCPRRRLWRRG